MISITLTRDGQPQRYNATGINLAMSLEAYDLYKEYSEANGDYSYELLAKLDDYIVRLFDKQFTSYELGTCYKGSAFRLYPAILNSVIMYVEEQIVNFPEPLKAATGRQTSVAAT